MKKVSASLLRLYDIFTVMIISAVLAITIPSQAHAYVDPSVMTYTIQAIAGVAVALSAVLGVALRKTRRTLMRILRIDENANKQIDPEVHQINKDAANRLIQLEKANNEALAFRQEQTKQKQVKNLAWPQRIIRALIASFFTIGTIFIVAPIEIVAGSYSSLLFGVADITLLVFITGIVLAVVIALLLSIVHGRAFDIALSILVAIGVCCYIQAFFLNQSLPIADGRALDLMQYKKITLISTLVWVAIIAAFLFLNKKKPSIWRAASLGICICLIIVQGVGVTSLIVGSANQPDRTFFTKEGLFEVGSQSNVIVFVLDTFDTQEMDHLLEDDPSLLDEFTGFTYFANTTGSMIPTRYGIPYLLTGRMPDGDKSYLDFIDSWYTDSTLLPDIKQADYSLGIYTDSIESSYLNLRNIEGKEFVEKYTSNVIKQSEVNFSLGELAAILGKMSLYRDMPWLIKPLFWFYTNDVNIAAVGKQAKDQAPYALDDAIYAEELFNRGLSISPDESKAFRFIHLNGAHIPYTIDETGHEITSGTTLDQQSSGSLTMVEYYITQLKELGLYDEATIIVTADHGNWYLTTNLIKEPTSPIMLVKPSETATEAAAPLKISYAPTGHLDYAATIIDAIGGDSSLYGPTVFEVDENNPRQRYYWMSISDEHNDYELIQFVIDGYALDFENWALTGNTIDVHSEIAF